MDILPEHKKNLISQHQMWLSDPTTQSMLKVIANRQSQFDKTLIDGIRIGSNQEEETKLRACINTCKAIIVLVTNSDKFVEQATKREQENNK